MEEMYEIAHQPIQPVFHNNINRFMYFPQQRYLQCFLFRITSHNYVYLVILLTQKESVEFLVRSIHLVHFIQLYRDPQPRITGVL